MALACLNVEKKHTVNPLFDKDPKEIDVYLCNSSGGKKYHLKSNCRGLNRCKAKIIKVSLKEAKKRGKTLCGWED